MEQATIPGRFRRDIQSFPDTFTFEGEERSIAAFLDETWTTGLTAAVGDTGLGFDEDYDSFTSDINMLPVRVFGFRDDLPGLVRETG
ncbi:MAG: hypothetical protein ACLFP4_14385 [Spirochaetales bacterium]